VVFRLERGVTGFRGHVLASPLSAVDTSALTKAEWRQIHSRRPGTVGDTVFNGWDWAARVAVGPVAARRPERRRHLARESRD